MRYKGQKGAGFVPDGESGLPVGVGVSDSGAKTTVGDDVVGKGAAMSVGSSGVSSYQFA